MSAVDVSRPPRGSEPPLVLVTVGTDHHPFARLVGWVDEWLAERSGPDVRCLLQHGTAPPPRRAEAVDVLPHDELAELAGRAAAIVCQAGPASVALSRGLGRKPIVVARSRRMGEHVDDHQVAFARRLEERGRAVTVEDATGLAAALERALAEPGWLAIGPGADDDVAASVGRFAAIADPLIAVPATPSGRPPRLLPRLSRSLDRAAYVRLAGYTEGEYEAFRLSMRSRREARDLMSAAQAHNVVRPALNDPRDRDVLDDKWRFARFVAEHALAAPRTLGRFDPADGTTWEGAPLRDAAGLAALLERERPDGIVVKPAGGRLGRGLLIGELSGDGRIAPLGETGEISTQMLAARLSRPGPGEGGYVVQERIRPHPDVARVWPELIGSIRVMSLLGDDGRVSVEAAAIRFGRRGVTNDAFLNGSLGCRVEDLATGTLGVAVTQLGRSSYATHPDTGVELAGLRLPCWAEALRLVERAALALPALRVIGWDVAISDRGPVLLEGNENWGVDLVQAHGRGILTPRLRAELAAAGVSSAEAVPTPAMALRRLRGRLRRRRARARR